jgi:hypothetical protein
LGCHVVIAVSNGACAIIHPMADQTVIVWDLETVPDLSAAARMLGLGTAPEAEVRGALGPGFPKHPSIKSSASGLWSRAVSQKAGASTPLGPPIPVNATKPI